MRAFRQCRSRPAARLTAEAPSVSNSRVAACGTDWLRTICACAEAISGGLTLPSLQPGDHYSLFLTGTAAKPVLRGQVSATDPYAQ